MPNMNKCEIIGHLSKEPELRFTPNGKPVCNFSVPVNRYFVNGEGEKIQNTDWFDVVTFNKQAEVCNQFLSKGKLVYVSGRVQLNKWETKDGKQGSRLELYAERVVFLSPKNDNGQTETETEDMPF